ncbi:MAG: tRNA epoxyqueuosine(34) reductase QueG [Gammaproteobacteria bacterium]|nr:tRNA epoxyqueuosine(34) reductase QueG [Gammaproteobacteria bacterium]
MTNSTIDLLELAADIKRWGRELGFQQVGITDTHLEEAESYLNKWLANNYHGEMTYMHKHGSKRSRPAELVPNTLRIISLRMDYLPSNTRMVHVLGNKNKAYISRYALGRDYHKVIKKRLLTLANKINDKVDCLHYRAFVDSAPVLEKAIAEKAGLGWLGKNTLIINKQAGSWFFLGEIFVNIPLPIDTPATPHCGSCSACIDICPTQAIVGPYQLDARRCISYLTIELKTAIPKEFRSLIGNRIFGCDDCQIICPWNKFAKITREAEFHARTQLNDADLVALFSWSEEEFNRFTEGSAIRRAGYQGWRRNIAVALGNAPTSPAVVNALKERFEDNSDMVKEHILWALQQHEEDNV